MASCSDDTETSIQVGDLDKLHYNLKGLLFVKVEDLLISDCLPLQISFGGWRPDLLIDKLSVREEKLLICSTCHGVMRDAVFYGKVSTCEVCVNIEGCDSAFDNDTARDIINELQIKCPLTEEDCDWTGAIETLTAHFSSCLYYPVPCPLECTVIDKNTTEPVITALPRHVVESHVQKICHNREINCKFCNTPIKAVEMDIHLSECEAFPLACPNNCIDENSNDITQLTRGQMSNHIEIECTNEEIDCPFKPNGCTIGKILRKNLATHEQDSMSQHLRLMNRKLEENYAHVSPSASQLEDELKQTKLQIHDLKTQLDNQEKDILTKYDGLTNRVDLQAMKINRISAKISFEWTITKIGDHLAKQSKLESKTFYMSNYKCFCSVHFKKYQNDAFDLIQNSFGFYAHFTPGAYDSSLQWPFSGSGKFILINQDDVTDNYVQVVKSDANNLEMFKKPTSGPNAGWGCREFITFSRLSHGGKYRKMDSIILSFKFS